MKDALGKMVPNCGGMNAGAELRRKFNPAPVKVSTNVTESFHDYKDYVIRLRAVKDGGFWFAIIKEVPNKTSPKETKKLYLVKRGWNFISPEELMKRAKNYVDKHEDNLIRRYGVLTK